MNEFFRGYLYNEMREACVKNCMHYKVNACKKSDCSIYRCMKVLENKELINSMDNFIDIAEADHVEFILDFNDEGYEEDEEDHLD